MSWDQIRTKRNDPQRPWRWGADITRAVRVYLGLSAAKELVAEVVRRTDALSTRLVPFPERLCRFLLPVCLTRGVGKFFAGLGTRGEKTAVPFWRRH